MIRQHNLNKRKLVFAVADKLNNKIHYLHINNVVNLLIDEFNELLKQKRKIKIGNFGIFTLDKTIDRKFFNFKLMRVDFTESRNILKFKLNKKLRKYIVNSIDLGKTFL